jgi:hypothetical protein
MLDAALPTMIDEVLMWAAQIEPIELHRAGVSAI